MYRELQKEELLSELLNSSRVILRVDLNSETVKRLSRSHVTTINSIAEDLKNNNIKYFIQED